MSRITTELEQKKVKLNELIKSRSKANCSAFYSSEADVRRESEIEDLEDEIRELEYEAKKR